MISEKKFRFVPVPCFFLWSSEKLEGYFSNHTMIVIISNPKIEVENLSHCQKKGEDDHAEYDLYLLIKCFTVP